MTRHPFYHSCNLSPLVIIFSSYNTNIRKSYAIFNCHKNKLFDSLQLNLLEIQSSRFDFSWNFHQMCENYHFPFGSKILSCRHTICMRKMIFKSICWKIVSEIMSIYRKHILVNAKPYHIEPRTAILITVFEIRGFKRSQDIRFLDIPISLPVT